MTERIVSPDIKIRYRDITGLGLPSTIHIERLLASFGETSIKNFNTFAENTMGAWFKDQRETQEDSKNDIVLPEVQLLGTEAVGRVVEYEVSDASKIKFIEEKVPEEIIRFSTVFMVNVDDSLGLVFAIKPEISDTTNVGTFIPEEAVHLLHPRT